MDDPTANLTVAIDAGPLLGPITGIGAAVGEMIHALEARGDVTLRPYALSFRGTLLPGMTRLPLPAAIAQHLWSRVPWPRLDHWFRPAQVVHGTNYAMGPSRLPRVVTVYDCWFLHNRSDASPVVARAGAVLRRAVASGATVHASSHATAATVRDVLSTDRVEVIHLAPLPRPPTSAVAGRAPIAELDSVPFVLALGTLERRKNLPRLIIGFAEIAGAHPSLRLVLAGADGDDRPAIDAAMDVLPATIRTRVVRTGRIDAGTKDWLLSHASVLAYPSLDEGFGFPLLEAMQYDVPVVASSRGSIPEVAGDAAVLVDPLDASAIAGALERTIADDTLRAGLVAAGREQLTVFSWDNTARDLAALYHRLVGEGS